MPRKSLNDKARAIDQVLTRIYGKKEIEGEEDPLDTLIETILSQNTTDKNSHRSYLALKRKYGSWDQLLDEDPVKVAGIIRSGGLADIKAERIIGALRFVKEKTGKLDLGFLKSMSSSEAEAWLAQMKGVGPKTRGIVLLFSLRMPAFPVDTHIHRVTRRLGLIGPKVTREKAQAELARLVSSKDFYNFHINIIEHGRAVCRARNPRCDVCRVSGYCDYLRSLERAR